VLPARRDPITRRRRHERRQRRRGIVQRQPETRNPARRETLAHSPRGPPRGLPLGFTSGGVKGLAQAHAAFFKTKSIGIYGKMVKDSLPSAVPAALIQGILPGQPNGQWFPPKFSPTNAVSGILTGLFG